MFYTDLHIHSKYSRATSKDLDLEQLCLWGAKKGLSVISTGDFTHPKWFDEIQQKLDYIGNGLFKLKDEIEKEIFKDYPNLTPVKFLLSVEISTIYKAQDKTRKVHHVVFCPDIESAQKFRSSLDKIGNINSDGRPILGLSSRNLLELTLKSSEDSYIIPAHIWTPWFSALGSKSGYDSIEDCYEDLSPYIFALETGLSSDPYMNWRVSKLDKYRLVSNSDAHSASKLAREATVFDDFPDYFYIKNALITGSGYHGTIEFFPEEGKYHADGHRKCGVCLNSADTKKLNNICPVCNKPLTIGVSYRVEELSDKVEPFDPPSTAGKVYSLIPLVEILAEIFGVGSGSKKVLFEYESLIKNLGSELAILKDIELDKIEQHSIVLKEAIKRLRDNSVIKTPGYDGEYGVIKLFKDGEAQNFLNLKLGLNIEQVKKPEKKEYTSVTAQVPKNIENKTKIFKPDEAQLEAILSDNQNIIIKAGPGSGKTAVLTQKIAYMAKEKNIFEDTILAITFTKKASSEMRSRLEKLGIKNVNIHTFHSLCYEILKEKADLIGLNKDFKIITKVEQELYQNSNNSLDFDDLLTYTLKLFKQYPNVLKEYQDRYKYIFIDEYQDIDSNQYELIKLIKASESLLFAIGDPNQAIYGFRGGNSEYFDKFKDDYENVKIINLNNNYRSTKTIVEASNEVINEFDIQSKVDFLSNKITIHSAPSQNAEAEFVVSTIEKLIGGRSFFSFDSNRAYGYENEENYSFCDFAILYRTKAQLKLLKEALDRISMPWADYSDDLLCKRKDIRKFLSNLRNDKSLVEQIGFLKENIENSVYEYFLELAEKAKSIEDFIHEVCFLTLADTYNKKADRISLMTMHASKGLEFKCVIIVGVQEGLIPYKYAVEPEELAEEKRLFYVGLTRAQQRLYLSYSEKINDRGTFVEQKSSRFLQKIKDDLFNKSKFDKKYDNINSLQLKLF